jgi:peptidoglycan/LPS O-acetylase OafA/YrhL
MSATKAELPRQLDILQVYRGLAATLVVLYHLTWWGGDPRFLKLPYWLPGMPTW